MPEPIKNAFNADIVTGLAGGIRQVHPAFDREQFIRHVIDADWESRELKQRMRHVTTVLGAFLPEEYRLALKVMRETLPLVPEIGFAKMVFPDFVEVYGLEDWEASMAALELFTQEASAEFAIRPFSVRYPERTMTQMLKWAGHPHPEVRRLASEGCRPRLPWGIRIPSLIADPSAVLPILERLKTDPSESVRRSVANNLNDISKDHPEVVIELLRQWQTHETTETERITRHALRTLLKQGHPDALTLLGYASEPAIAVKDLTVAPKTISVGDEINFSFQVTSLSDEPQNLMVDYVIFLMRANGTQTPKVFKLTTRVLRPGDLIQISRRHSFKPVTTRRYYPGQHAIQPKINGKLFERVTFTLSHAVPSATEIQGGNG